MPKVSATALLNMEAEGWEQGRTNASGFWLAGLARELAPVFKEPESRIGLHPWAREAVEHYLSEGEET